jgi:O-acetyl-ADP-ribose deacetylase (regulator of RNase III)
MSIKIIKGDITRLKVDAIVNSTNSSLENNGGVNGAIHAIAGEQLLEEYIRLGGVCNVGEAKITKAYNLDAKYVIHTFGPVWRGGNHGEHNLLRSCFANSLQLAKQYNLATIAFPLII